MVNGFNTAIKRTKASAPLAFLLGEGLILGKVLDYGCGRGFDGNHLISLGYTTTMFDPYWNNINIRNSKYDTILSTYVLNVVKKEKEDLFLSKIKKHLRKNGSAYISVRRDFKKESYRSSRGFQRLVSLNLPIVYNKKGSYCIYKLE